MNAKLTATQTTILKAAAARPDGNIEPLPTNLRGGARTAVIDGLLARDLITKFDGPDHVEYYLTDAAYAAVGRKCKMPAPVTPEPEIEAAVSAAEAKRTQDKRDVTKPRTRENSKQAAVVQMPQRPDGTTIRQVMETTGWQAHTVRGTFAGALKKKLGLTSCRRRMPPANGRIESPDCKPPKGLRSPQALFFGEMARRPFCLFSASKSAAITANAGFARGGRFRFKGCEFNPRPCPGANCKPCKPRFAT